MMTQKTKTKTLQRLSSASKVFENTTYNQTGNLKISYQSN